MVNLLTDMRSELTTRGKTSALAVAELVRSLDDGGARRVTPGLEWTAIETAVHVVNLYGRALGDRRRSQTPGETASLNATCIGEFEDRDPRLVADRIAADAVKVWDEILPLVPDDLELPFHAGSTSTIVPLMGVLLMEMLVHGDDIARASGRPWVVTDDDAWCALRAITVLLPAWRRPDDHSNDTIAFAGPSDDEAIRVTCHGPETAVVYGPMRYEDRAVTEAPKEALLGLFGRRATSPPLSDLVERFGPF